MAWIPRRLTAKRYGVCRRTVQRWEDDPRLNFPQPMIRNGRKYDNEEKLHIWDEACAAEGRATLRSDHLSAAAQPETAEQQQNCIARRQEEKAA